jgi:heptaprenylglyceryl phosphate synthase
MPLLYVDLLGMKARYQSGGVRSARRGYRILGEMIAEALSELPSDRPVSGGVQSDAAALQFATAVDAVIVGRAVFRETLMRSTRNRRLWIRGVIMRGGRRASERAAT